MEGDRPDNRTVEVQATTPPAHPHHNFDVGYFLGGAAIGTEGFDHALELRLEFVSFFQ